MFNTVDFKLILTGLSNLFCRFPKLRLLDFRKIRQKDRQEANELFKSKKGKEILKEIAKKAKVAAANPINDANNARGEHILPEMFDSFN